MVDNEAGVPAANPSAPVPAPAPQAPQAPQVPQAPQALHRQQFVHLKWSNFKSEFSGKPDGDAEAHLLHTNDWMNALHFIEGVRVQRFCLTPMGEARLWYQSLDPINVDWQGL